MGLRNAPGPYHFVEIIISWRVHLPQSHFVERILGSARVVASPFCRDWKHHFCRRRVGGHHRIFRYALLQRSVLLLNSFDAYMILHDHTWSIYMFLGFLMFGVCIPTKWLDYFCQKIPPTVSSTKWGGLGSVLRLQNVEVMSADWWQLCRFFM